MMSSIQNKALYDGCGEETVPLKDSKKKGGRERICAAAQTDLPGVQRFCDDHHLPPEAFFATAFALALKSYTASENAFFTCLRNGKKAALFLNCGAGTDVTAEIGTCRDFLTSVFEDEEYSYEGVSKAHDLKGSVCFEFAPAGAEEQAAEDSEAEAGSGPQLLLRVLSGENGAGFVCDYDASAYTPYTVNGLIRMTDNIAGEFLTKERLADVRAVLPADEENIKNIYDSTGPWENKPGYRHLQDSAAKYPDRRALIAIDRTMTYRELNGEANALGHVLREHGAEPEVKIAVLADRNSHAYVMREGVLKSGAAFMPVDPEYPEERILYILEDSGCKLLVTTREIMDRRGDLMEKLRKDGVDTVEVEEAVSRGDRTDLNIDVPGEALAYIIYTSGSTGKPKGVMIRNRNLANFVADNEHNKEVKSFIDHGSVTLAMAAFTFDVSVVEEFVPLSHGQTVVLATMDQVMDAEKIKDLIIDNQVEIITCTPTYILGLTEIRSFAPAIRCLKTADVGAEAFPPVLYEKLHAINPDLYIINTYGPTECTVTCTLKELDSSEDITIGYPLANVKLATLDRDGRLQVPGALGEMVIMGAGVGRGYIGREDLNQRNFITLLGLPAYRSGDLVRMRADGDIEFHGRIDNQVKLRGLRVELGEVENVLGSYPGVRSCVVIVAKGQTDYLAAYFTADEPVDLKKLKAHMASYLTAYMVPQAIMQLDEMPMNANGKIDKKALPEAVMMEAEIVPPENEVQESILSAAKEVTGSTAIGITTNLFEAGLSSIGSITLCARLQEQFGCAIKTSDLFDSNTVRDIEKLVSGAQETVSYEIREEYPLSMTQTGIYIECMRYPGSTLYNIPELHRLGDGVDTKRLAAAIGKAAAAHPYLFMAPVQDREGKVHAKRRDSLTYEAPVIRCEHLPSGEELVRPFSLDSGEILFRAEIYETEEGNYFFLDTHHIVSDGGSLEILARDIDRAYAGERIEKETYTGYEFALDEKAARESSRLDRAKAWYDSIFASCGGETLPVRDGQEGESHVSLERITGETDAKKVQDFCRDHSCTLNAFFITAFALALKSYTASEKAVFTTIYNGRSDLRLENSVSMLVKTLPVCLECAPEEKVSASVENCQKFLLSAMANDIYSFAEIRNAYDIKARIMFVYQGMFEHGIRIGGELTSLEMLGLSRARADLGIDLSIDGSKLVFELEYDPTVFSAYTVRGLVRMTDNIIGEFLTKDRLGDVRAALPRDEEDIKNIYDASAPWENKPGYRHLQDSAAQYPDRRALIAVDRILTYRELNEEANALGHVLREHGAEPEVKIAVLADRNSYAYVMREGVLKSGAAFMPVDPEYPEERILYILEDSGCKLLVTTREIMDRRGDLMEKLRRDGVDTVEVEEAVSRGDRTDLNIDVPSEALAYIIYTSGSTGKPKGVMIRNRNLANFVADNEHNKEVKSFIDHGSVTLAMAAFTFDVSVLEEFVPLSHGQTVVLATMDQVMDAEKIKDLIIDNQVEIIACTPTYILGLTEIRSFAPAIRCLKTVDVGAEAFPPVLYEKLHAINPDLYIINTYGPTECTVTCTLKDLDSSEDITIGYPLANVKFATLDRDGRLQVPGALGELVIMGAGVGRGYIGREDLNQRNFITLLGLPAYRSGDLVRMRSDGDIEFHGRIDNQVKLRGLRVELGEVENVLGSYPGVRSCVVIVAKGQTDYLAAYFTADEPVDLKKLKAHMASYLTAYMVPQAIMQLDEMPMNANGKIDKKALPEAVMMEEEIVPPENEVQRKILAAAEEVIGQVHLGITSDLFVCGLSSIGCIRLCALLSEQFGRNIRVSDIFENSTVQAIEKLLGQEGEARDYTVREEYPLSMTQAGIYVECVLHPGSTTYNIPEIYRLDPRVDPERLARAVDQAVRAHPYLFMQPVKDKQGIVHARRRDDHPFQTAVIRTDKLPAEEELVRPFSVDSGEVLFRAEIYETGDGNYFFLDLHHIVADGESFNIFLEDVEKCFAGGNAEPETYTGYEAALDEEAARQSERLEKARKWYDSIFAGCGGETMPAKDGDRGDNHIGNLLLTGKSDGMAVRRFCQEHDITLNAFYTAAFGLALKSYTCAENAVFSTIYHGRNDARLQNSVSMLVKTFPVYIEGEAEKEVMDVLRDCQSFLLSAMANDIYSFAEIRNAYDITADILFAFQGEQEKQTRIGGEDALPVELSVSRARADLGLDVLTDGASVLYDLEYDPAVYSEYTARSFAHMVDRVVSELTRAQKVRDIRLTDEADEKRIRELHDSDFPVKERPAYRLLQDAAEKYPDRKALVAADRTLTYRQLNEEANALGSVLRQHGAGPESIVAVMPERDSYAYVMRQGVLRSGGAFLPIDPEYPEERVRFILEDSGAKMLVTGKTTLEKRSDMFREIEASGVRLIAVEDAVKEGSRDNLNVEVPYDALAYVIYTSGSTGKPKGVMLTNKNLVNFVDDDEKNHEILGYTRRGHVSLAIAALTFDFSIMEEFVPLANGLTVVLARRDDIMNPMALAGLMTENHVDVMSCTPSYIMNLLDMGEFTDALNDALRGLKSVDLGAEAFPAALFDKLKAINPDICIMNGYGPTEATISCTMQIIEDTEKITIGVPNVNVHVATVDRDGRLQGLGALGELVIMGDGVGRGYIGREDLNRKNFIRLLDMPAYRSGDLVRIRENGDIEYHGRIDNQVKLRGLRVELGEIESVMNSYPGVRSSIVIVIKKETEYLAAYFTADEKVDIGRLKEHLASQLTAYMVPQTFMQLDEMPLTANGKIDKKALPVIGAEEIAVEPPRNDRQETILDMVKEIVGDVRIGITTDLFAAGLSSLGCIRLCAMLAEKFGRDITIAELFDNRTVLDIEGLLDTEEEDETFDLREEYPLSMTQMGIFVESIHYPDSTIYNIPFLYELDPDTNMGRMKKAIAKTLRAHPYLSMTLKRNDEGEVFAVRSRKSRVRIDEGRVLPPDDELVRPFNLLSDEPLCRIGLYDTDGGKYLFVDAHHILSDGESFEILLEDINRAYRGEKIEAERYTGFEAALREENERSSPRFNRAKEWYDKLLKDCGRVSLPVAGEIRDHAGDGTGTWEGQVSADEITAFCDRNQLSLNAFFTFAAGMALWASSGTRNAVFATIYNGRNDSRLNRSIGMFVKTVPVCMRPTPDMIHVVEAISQFQAVLVNNMAYDIYSFAEICTRYDLNSDVIFAYQGRQDADDVLRIGEGEAREKPLSGSREQAKSPFGLDVSLQGSKVVYEFECDPSLYDNTAMGRFYSLMENIIIGLMKYRSLTDVMNSPAVRELSASADSRQERAETAPREKDSTGKAAAKTAPAAARPAVDTGTLEQQLLEIYRKILNNQQMRPKDNFFELGGTSLLAAKLMMALMVKNYPVVYQNIFDAPTPEKLAELLAAKMAENLPESGEEHEEISAAPEKSGTPYERALCHNNTAYVSGIAKGTLGSVLLTGATGFLGIHMLRELLRSDAEKIYCLVRRGRLSAEDRLKENYFYYFDELDEGLFGNRIIPVTGDITSKDALKALSGYDIQTVINCAASVKHFAELESLKEVNVYGVRNLVELCLERRMRLIHISTASIAGDTVGEGQGNALLTEDAFDLGQEVESNAYVYTKYLAEQHILKAIDQQGLDAKIIRVGNLMSRFEDGEFQINFNTNNFMNTLKAYAALGCFPVTELDEKDEFSPIDEVARATLLLAGTDRKYTVFHAYNSHSIEMGDVILALNHNDIKVDIVEEEEFNERLNAALKDDRINSFVSPLVNYRTDNEEEARPNDVDNSFTVKALYRLGFHWDITDMGYIDTAIAMLKTLGFFDVK